MFCSLHFSWSCLWMNTMSVVLLLVLNPHWVSGSLQQWWVPICLGAHEQGFFLQWRAEWSPDSWSNLTFLSCFCTRWWWLHCRDLGSFLCSQQQTRGLWSLLCNAGLPSFQISGGIQSTLTALRLLNCSMTWVISFTEGSSSNSALNGCWGLWRTAKFWMTQSVLKRDWKCLDQWLRMEALSVKSTCHLHWARDSGPGELGWRLCRSSCSHLGLLITEFSLWD